MVDGQDTFSKFRSCCNHFSTFKDPEGNLIPYKGFEDRWTHDLVYRNRPAVLRDIPDRISAMHRDVQAGLYFKDNLLDPYDPNIPIKELLMKARVWNRVQAEEHATRQELYTTAANVSEASFRPHSDLKIGRASCRERV